MSYKIITPPSEEPVSLGEAKTQCRVDGAEFDTLLGGFIVAAREAAEHETGRALCTQTRELVLDAFPEAFVLHGAPIKSLVHLKYLDEYGIEQTLDPQDTLLDIESEPGYLVPAYGKSWPATYPVPNSVRVRYVCGYGGASDIPKGIKSWMLLAIETLFDGGSVKDDFWCGLIGTYKLYGDRL